MRAVYIYGKIQAPEIIYCAEKKEKQVKDVRMK